jgi:putative ABC transport system ATP-binding protein
MDITDKIIEKNNLTTMMVTHNMHNAIHHGNRLIMMYEGRIVVDVKGQEKKDLTVPELLARFEDASGDSFANDRALLG